MKKDKFGWLPYFCGSIDALDPNKLRGKPLKAAETNSRRRVPHKTVLSTQQVDGRQNISNRNLTVIVELANVNVKHSPARCLRPTRHLAQRTPLSSALQVQLGPELEVVPVVAAVAAVVAAGARCRGGGGPAFESGFHGDDEHQVVAASTWSGVVLFTDSRG